MACKPISSCRTGMPGGKLVRCDGLWHERLYQKDDEREHDALLVNARIGYASILMTRRLAAFET